MAIFSLSKRAPSKLQRRHLNCEVHPAMKVKLSQAALATGLTILTIAGATVHAQPALPEMPHPGAVAIEEATGPQVGEPIPHTRFVDSDGKPFTLASLRGKVLLIRIVEMDSPVDQTLAGAKDYGPLGEPKGPLPEGIYTLRSAFMHMTQGASYTSDKLAHVYLLLTDESGNPATRGDAAVWASHFIRATRTNEYVIVSESAGAEDSGPGWKPGFVLVDRNLIVRGVASGEERYVQLARDLMPWIPTLLREAPAPGMSPTEASALEQENGGRILLTNEDLTEEALAGSEHYVQEESAPLFRFGQSDRSNQEKPPQSKSKDREFGRTIHANQSQFKSMIKEEHLTVVDFYADWCGPCKKMAPTIDSLARKNRDVAFLKVDVDDEPQLAAKYGIRSIPTLIFFKNGREVAQLKGLRGEAALQKTIDKEK